MKMRKGISAVLAGVMALAALPVSAMSASAEGAYALGDVDMDGYITGHDAAMVTRALYVDNSALNDEQLKLADVNGDGVVDQNDADWIHENQVLKLGQVCSYTNDADSTTLYYQLVYCAYSGIGKEFTIVSDEDVSLNELKNTFQISQLNFNLLDANGDGKIDIDDISGMIGYVCYKGAGYDINESGKYYYELTMFNGVSNAKIDISM
ncbi:dockerin type I repeat-containing protein [Ruminococcus sp.]